MTSSSLMVNPEDLDLLSHIDRLSSENALLRFELEWNRRLTSHFDWLAWFARAAGNQAVAWIPRDGSRPAAHPPALLPHTPELAGDLLPAPGAVTTSLLIAESGPVAAGRNSPTPLYPFAVGARTGVLLLRNWPVISGDPDVDREFVRQLLAELALNSPLPEKESPLPAAELQLVQEMLELRALTDLEFRSPQEMLNEFLRKLADLVDVERAALFLKSSPGTFEEEPGDTLFAATQTDRGMTQITRAAVAGRAIPRGLADLWDHWEHRYAECRISDPAMNIEQEAHCDFSASASQDSLPEFSPRMASWFPILHADGVEGWLLLSSRQHRQLDSSDKSLIDWAGQFMLASFFKAEERNQLETRARRDALTSLANRHTFDIEFPRLLQRCARDHSPCSLLLVDIDHFKRVNDEHGHLAGDQVLRGVAQVVAQAAQGQRVTDRPLVARYGGEEFAIILPDVPLAGARRIAEDILLAVRSQPIACGDQQLQVTVSIGVAAGPAHASDCSQLFTAADQALYEAKRSGRNRSVGANSGLAAPVGLRLATEVTIPSHPSFPGM